MLIIVSPTLLVCLGCCGFYVLYAPEVIPIYIYVYVLKLVYKLHSLLRHIYYKQNSTTLMKFLLRMHVDALQGRRDVGKNISHFSEATVTLPSGKQTVCY